MRITKTKLVLAFGAVVAGLALFSGGDVEVENDGLNLGESWNDFTIPAPEVETNRVNRAAYATTLRNPLDLEAGEATVTSVVYESRDPLYMDDPRFDAVGRLVYKDGLHDSLCTATLSSVKGYVVKGDDPFVLSGAHCMLDDERQFLPLENFTFVADYIDTTGQLQTFSSKLLEASALWNKSQGVDIAAFTLQSPVPKGMLIPVAIPDYSMHSGQQVSALGYSVDKKGAHIDDCRITFASIRYSVNNCDIASGASGGPLIVSSNEQGFQYASVNLGVADDKITYHSSITSDFLDAVPFLEKKGQRDESKRSQSDVKSRQCVEVTASILNIRSGRSTDFNVIAKAERGAHFVELDRIGNWSQIQLPDNNRSAYVHNGFVSSYSC